MHPPREHFGTRGAGVDIGKTARELTSSKFSFMQAEDWALGRTHADALEELAESWDRLVLDDHMRAGDTFRRRRFCKFVVRTEDMAFEELNDFGFFQAAAINTYAGGTRREFAPIEPRVRNNAVVREIIRTCLRAIGRHEGNEDAPTAWKVHVHQCRIDCSRSMIGRPTPEGLHRDGHDFVGMHLMSRCGIDGGISDICDSEGRSLMKVTLENRMDGFLVDDRVLLHGVSQITPSTGDTGHRDMLVIDYNREDPHHENRNHRQAA